MLDIKFVRENIEKVKTGIAKKGADPALVDEAVELDGKRRRLLTQLEDFQNKLNVKSKEIAEYHSQQKVDAINDATALSDQIKQIKPKLEDVNISYLEIMDKLPNLPSEDTPNGKDESENKVIRSHGDKPKIDQPKEHWQIGEELGIIDIARATKVSGPRFGYIKGELALLQFALIQFTYSVITNEEILKKIAKDAKLDVSTKPFISIIPPVFIKPPVFAKMARLEPKEERYYIPSDDLFLIGSAEHTLGSMHMDETFDEKDLPLRYAGYSTSFRREAGSYGKDMKGMLRVHQFDKLEMESFTVPENSIKEQNFIVAIQEYLMQQIEVPYQVVQICTGDMGGPDARQIDIESWLPGQDKYRETHTSDLMTDYQARRLNTRVKRKDGKTEFVHMNDATAFAMGRALIAITENYQQKDGTINVPEVLKKWTGFSKIGGKKGV